MFEITSKADLLLHKNAFTSAFDCLRLLTKAQSFGETREISISEGNNIGIRLKELFN
jgi:hypothetical protein